MITAGGIVLAGGKSRRFGSPKAFATIDGQPFYMRSIKALMPFVKRMIIVTNEDLKPFFGKGEYDVVKDMEQYTGHGPLAGIYSAMERFSYPWYAVVPVDVPFIDENVFQAMLPYCQEPVQAVIPVVNGKKEPLIAIYHHSVKDSLSLQLSRGKRSVHQWLKEIPNVCEVAMENEKPFININRQWDFETYIAKRRFWQLAVEILSESGLSIREKLKSTLF